MFAARFQVARNKYHKRFRLRRRSNQGSNYAGSARRRCGERRQSPYSAQRRSTSARISALISISAGHSRAPSVGQLGGRVDPELAADELALGRVVEMVGGPVGEDDVAGRIDVRARRRTATWA